MDVRWAGVSNGKKETESKSIPSKPKKSVTSNAILKELLTMSNELRMERENNNQEEGNSTADFEGAQVIFYLYGHHIHFP